MTDPGTPKRSPARGWALAAIGAALCLVFYVIHDAVLPFVIAAAVAFVAEPLIRRLQPRFGGHRWIPATLFFILLLVFFGFSCFWIGRIASDDLVQLARNGPRMIHDLLIQLVGKNGVSVFGKTYTADALTRQLQQNVGSAIGPGGAAEAAGLGIGMLIGTFLTLVLIPYFLISGPRISDGLIWLLPPERRGSVERMLPAVVPVLRRYLGGVAVVVAFTAIAAYIGFGLVFALPHAILLSIAVGLLEIIPALGPFASMMLIMLSAFQEHNFLTIALLIAYAVFLRLAIDNGVGPIVLGRSAKLHPVAIMFAFVCGATFFGVVGLLLAVPASACLVVVLERYYAEPLAGREPER